MAELEKSTPKLRIYTVAFHACWVLIVVAAAVWRFRLPLELLSDRDVWGYLSPALTKITRGVFAQVEGRAFVYPGLIYVMLSIFRSLTSLAILQHVLGLATGALLLANWTTARRLLPRPIIPPLCYDLCGLVLMAIYLFSAQSVLGEHHLRPEGISPFFAVLGFWFTLRFLVAKHVEHNATLALYCGAASLGVSFLLPLLKPSYSLAAVLTTLPVWWHLLAGKDKLVRRVAMAGGPVLAALLLLWLPEHRYVEGDPKGQFFLPASLFTIHAAQIRAQMASDVASNATDVPYPHEQLQSILTLLDTEMELSRPSVRRGFAALGFNPDYLLYSSESFCHKLTGILPERTARADFYRFYFRRTWRKQPAAMLHKFVIQLGLFYNFDCPVYEEKTVRFNREYSETRDMLADTDRAALSLRVPAVADYLNRLPALTHIHAAAVQPKVLAAIFPIFACTYLPLLILAAAGMLWVIAAPDLRAACGTFAVAVAVGYGYNFGNNIAIALFHTLGIGRYSHVQMSTTLLTQSLALCFVVEVVGQKIRSRRELPAPTPLPSEVPDLSTR